MIADGPPANLPPHIWFLAGSVLSVGRSDIFDTYPFNGEIPVRAIFNSRLWLIIWLGLGAVGLLYVILSSSLSGGDPTKAENHQSAEILRDPALQVGEMADFQFAFPAREAPVDAFIHEGKELTLADFRGKAVLVNFWATWCAPCLKELPSLDVLQRDLGGEDFAVVAVAADPRGPEVASEFLDRLAIRHLELYADPRLRLASAMGGAAVLPVSVLYDREGREIGRLVGEADWSSPEARELIERVIGR
jgi:thiol-disulfide isomerase/thioredoxin